MSGIAIAQVECYSIAILGKVL